MDIAKDARTLLPADLRADGFSNTAYNLNVDLKHINAYAQLADRIVARMDVRPFARRFGGNGSFTDKMRAFIDRLGRWILRGHWRVRGGSLAASPPRWWPTAAPTKKPSCSRPCCSRPSLFIENQQAGGREDAELAVRRAFCWVRCPMRP